MRKRSHGGDREAQRIHVAWWCVLLCVFVMFVQLYGCQRQLWTQPQGDHVQERPAPPVARNSRRLRVVVAHPPNIADREQTTVGQSSDGRSKGLQDHGAAEGTPGTAHAASSVLRGNRTKSSSSTASTAAVSPNKRDTHDKHGLGSAPGQAAASKAAVPDTQVASDSTPKQVCAGYLLGIGTTKGGTTSLWGYLQGWANVPFHPHLLAPANVASKELYWWMHSDPSASLQQYDALLQRLVHPPKEAQPVWEQLFRQQSSKLYMCPAPESKVMRGPQTAFKWLTDVNGTAVDKSKLTPLYRADVTPEYMYDPRVPARVRALLPEARMVIILRDPATRTISEWAMNWLQAECGLKSSMKKATTAEQKTAWQTMLHARISEGIQTYQDCYSKTLEKSRVLQQEFLTCLGYDNPYTPRFMQNALPSRCASGIGLVGHSVYVDQLERWFELFPASQFRVWVSEDFQHDASSHLLQLVDWLGLDPKLTSHDHKSGVPIKTKLHVGRYESQPEDATMNMLREFYAPHNERLFKLLEDKGFGNAAARMRDVWGGGVVNDTHGLVSNAHVEAGAIAAV